jgi:hypothetical protein
MAITLFTVCDGVENANYFHCHLSRAFPRAHRSSIVQRATVENRYSIVLRYGRGSDRCADWPDMGIYGKDHMKTGWTGVELRRQVMKAVRFDRYGGIEVLQIADVPMLEPSHGEALVKVEAASINPGEAKIREGLLHTMWPSTFPSGEGSDWPVS